MNFYKTLQKECKACGKYSERNKKGDDKKY